MLEVRERKLWWEKVSIPAGMAKLVKVWVEEDWKGDGFVESMLPEEQESGWELVFPKMLTIWQAEYKHTYIENNADEKGELHKGQRIWKIHSLYIDKETWLREELRGGSKPEVGEVKIKQE